MLTNEANHKRKWGRYPSLGSLFGAHQVPDHYYGWSSVSDNVFSWLNRVAEVAVTTKEYSALLRETTDPELIECLPADFKALKEELQAAARFFTEHAEVVCSLLHEARHRHEEHMRRKDDSERNA